jgi:hypothetical protein
VRRVASFAYGKRASLVGDCFSNRRVTDFSAPVTANRPRPCGTGPRSCVLRIAAASSRMHASSEDELALSLWISVAGSRPALTLRRRFTAETIEERGVRESVLPIQPQSCADRAAPTHLVGDNSASDGKGSAKAGRIDADATLSSAQKTVMETFIVDLMEMDVDAARAKATDRRRFCQLARAPLPREYVDRWSSVAESLWLRNARRTSSFP